MTTAKTKGFSLLSILYLAVLLGLIYMFHTELFVTGMRVYVSVVNSPRAERLLGDYYQHNAHQSDELANNFYTASMKKYKEQLSTAKPEDQSTIKFMIGQLYLCGKGMPANALEAKHWFDDALKLANDSNSKSPELINEIKENLSLASMGENSNKQNGDLPAPCRLQNEAELFSQAIKP